VLPPVDTRAWSPDTVSDHTGEVRGMFVETLANWPASSRRRLTPAP
jgi:hypothetical protein